MLVRDARHVINKYVSIDDTKLGLCLKSFADMIFSFAVEVTLLPTEEATRYCVSDKYRLVCAKNGL